MSTQAQRTCHRKCYYLGRIWSEGEIIAEGDIPEGAPLPRHFGGEDKEPVRHFVHPAEGVRGQKAPMPERRASEASGGPALMPRGARGLPGLQPAQAPSPGGSTGVPRGSSLRGMPATLAEAQGELIGETILQTEGEEPMSLGQAQAFQ